MTSRNIRLHTQSSGDDPRNSFQRDRDRILYSESLRRLGGITQVISPHDHTFHNRLTHTIEVSQIGQRMAQYLLNELPDGDKRRELISPDVVEAACLAHDLGHPPFGHVAEKTLDNLSIAAAKERGIENFEGFEGNAQSFRIVTRLALRKLNVPGLDLTRATLNAILKYPWPRSGPKGSSKYKKFGAYRDDMEAYRFAREGTHGEGHEPRSLEAQIMDHADAIAYAVHDLVDFYKAGLIPMHYLTSREGMQEFFDSYSKDILEGTNMSAEDAQKYLLENIDFRRRPYDGSLEEQLALISWSGARINQHIRPKSITDAEDPGLEVDWEPMRLGHPPILRIPSEKLLQINFLKKIIWHYIIDRPQLGTQQHGMRKIIKGLFETYYETIITPEIGDERIIPQSLRGIFDEIKGEKNTRDDHERQIRLAVDIVASLSDGQALEMYKRLIGVDPGKITDFIAN
ncbi:deoxyguanosinetriphosphate triphosphohydrolase family protein [Deinococcus multiflagellatus]|uniref:deoxyguanosinetriphosphate triphosphohydrolase family protein n=1 Tax=Deinococcus multiflagellatus TaxID=1656887 RepID=UPI001CC9D102|nr:dNTP triphosphohydrolase [Deinococcus multiflagellatus]MBZ9714680.1 dNTP triphosphohydrolase [Deinococcus multiflagellatus]